MLTRPNTQHRFSVADMTDSSDMLMMHFIENAARVLAHAQMA